MREGKDRLYFFDTSALVKRYHREAGTGVVDAAFDESDATRMISDISVIEFYSAFAKKLRVEEIAEEDFRETVKAFAEEIQNDRIQLAYFGDHEKKEAVALIEKYGSSGNLRTLDAMHLALMRSVGTEVITHVFCADRQFAEVIEKEGFCVIDPEQISETKGELEQ